MFFQIGARTASHHLTPAEGGPCLSCTNVMLLVLTYLAYECLLILHVAQCAAAGSLREVAKPAPPPLGEVGEAAPHCHGG